MLLALLGVLIFAWQAHADIRPWNPAQQGQVQSESNWGRKWLWIAGGGIIGATLAAGGIVVLRARRK
jgi:hypothetical protein